MCVCIFEGQQIILTKLQPLNTNDLLWSWNLLRYSKLFKAGPRETLGRRMKWKVGSTRGILCVLQTYFSGLKNKFVSLSLNCPSKRMNGKVFVHRSNWLGQPGTIANSEYSGSFVWACIQPWGCEQHLQKQWLHRVFFWDICLPLQQM